MATFGEATRRPIAFALSLGVLGGAALISTVSLTSRGPMVFVPYAALVIATALFLRVERVRPFMRRFSLALGSFMVATVALYVFIFTVANVPVIHGLAIGGHAWRLGMMLGIGSILSAAVAQLTSTRQPD
jgi:hypothetical protein